MLWIWIRNNLSGRTLDPRPHMIFWHSSVTCYEISYSKEFKFIVVLVTYHFFQKVNNIIAAILLCIWNVYTFLTWFSLLNLCSQHWFKTYRYSPLLNVKKEIWYGQGFGSGSGLDPYSIGPVDPDPDPDPGGQKWPTKVEKIHVLKCWMASFVSCRLLL